MLVVAFSASLGLAGDQQEFTSSEAFGKFRRGGREVVAERAVDLNGDGLSDVLVVGRSDDGLDVSAFWNKGRGVFDLLSRSRAVPASQLASFGPVALGDRQGFYLDAVEDSPDEADHFMILFAANPAGLVQVFHTRYREIHSEEEAGREAVQVVDLGGLTQGLNFVPASSGWPRLVLGFAPKSVELRTPEGKRARVLIGGYRRVFSAHQGRYRLDEDRFVDYLQPVPVQRISASSELDGHEAARAIDGEPVTGWISERADAVLGLEFVGEVAVRAVRLVPGCASSAAGWEDNGRAVSFSLHFPGDVVVRVDRSKPDEPDPRLLGFADYALPGLDFGVQTLVFFREALRVSSMKLVLCEIEAGSKNGGRVCLAEVTALQALADDR